VLLQPDCSSFFSYSGPSVALLRSCPQRVDPINTKRQRNNVTIDGNRSPSASGEYRAIALPRHAVSIESSKKAAAKRLNLN
jgi:hypothetical protein